MGSATDSVNAKIGNLGAAMHTMGLVGLGVFTAVVGFFALAEKAAITYQTALTNLQNTAALTDAQTSALGVTLENLAIGTTASAADMANAIAPVSGEIQQLTGHVLSAADATSILTAAQDVSVVKGVSLTATTKSIVDILRSYKLATSDAADVANTLVEGSDLLGISTTQLAQSFTRLQPRIVGSNMSLQDVMSTVVALGPAAGTGARAIMQVGTVIHALVEPSKAASAAMTAAGVSLYDSKGNYIGATAAIQALSVAYNKMGTEAQKTAFLQAVFGAQGKLAEQLIAGGQAGLDKATASLLANGTAAEKAALKMQDAQEQMDLLPKTINDIALPIGMVLLPSLNRFLSALTPILQGVAYWTTQNPQLAAAILGIVGALGLLTGLTVILGPALGVIAALVGSAIAPFILLGVAIGGLIYFLMQIPAVAQPVMAILGALGDLAKGEFGDFGVLFENIGKALSGGIKGGLSTVFAETGGEMLDNLKDRLAPIVAEFTKLGTAINNALSGILPQIVPAVTGFVNAMVDAFSAVLPVIASAIEGIGDAIIAALPSVGKAFLGISDLLVNLTTTMVDLLTANAPRILAAVISMVQSLLDWTLNTGVPGVATAAGGFVDAFSAWVPKAAAKMIAEVPEIIAAVQKMVTMIIAFAVKNVPVIAAKVLLWGQAFVGWVQQRLPALLASLQLLGTQVVAWIVKEAPILAAQIGQWAGAFVGWLSQTWPKALAALNSLIMNLLGWFTTVYPQIYNAALTWLRAMLGWVVQVLPGLLSAISTALSGMIDWMLNTGAPLLATAAGQLFDTLVADLPTVLGDVVGMIGDMLGVLAANLPDIIGKVLAILADLVSAIGGFVIANAPKLIEHLAQWGLALIGWIAGKITPMLAALGGMLGQVLNWIVSNGPQIAAKIASWIGFITGWIIAAAPYAVVLLGDLLVHIFDWITTNGPQLVTQFAAWVPKAVQWIIDAAAQIPGKLADFMSKIGGWIITNAPVLGKKATDLGTAMVNAIINELENLPSQMLDFLTNTLLPDLSKVGQFGMQIINGMIQLGKDLVAAIIQGLADLPGEISKAVQDAFASINIQVGPFHISGKTGVSVDLPKLPFAQGAWNLPNDVNALLHKGEMVVPAQMAENLRAVLSGMGMMGGAPAVPVPTGAPSWLPPSGSGGSYGDTHIHTHLYLDSKQIAERVDVHQGMRYLLAGTSRRRATGN